MTRYQTGRFFIPENSRQDTFSTEVYRYKGLYASSGDKENEFPVYVVFKRDIIEFQFQGKLPATAQPSVPIYGQSQILSISLRPGDLTSLTGIINQIFDKSFSMAKAYAAQPALGNSYYDAFAGAAGQQGSFFRELFADFLDDFFNSTVFYQSSRYDDVRTELLEIPIIRAIYLKADLAVKESSLAGATGTNEKHIKAISVRSALDKWIDFLANPVHNELFALSKDEIKWLNFKDIELSKAFEQLRRLKRLQPDGRLEEAVNRIANTQLRDYSLFRALQTVSYAMMGGVAVPKWKRGLQWAVALLLFGAAGYFLSTADYYPRESRLLHSVIILILLSTVAGGLLAFFGLLSRINASVNLLLPRLQMGVSTSWIGLGISNEVWKNNFDLLVGESLLVTLVLLIMTGSLIGIDIRKNTRLASGGKIFRKTLSVLLSGFVFSLFISLLVTTLWAPKLMQRSDFFESRYMRSSIFELDSMFSRKEKLKGTIDSLDHEIWKNEVRGLFYSAHSRKDSLSTGDTMRVRQQDAFLKDRRKKIDDTIHHIDTMTQPTLIIDSLRYGAYYLKDKKHRPYGRKASATITIKFVNSNYIVIFPGFFLAISAFALFSGIFLTLLFDDKPITNPL